MNQAYEEWIVANVRGGGYGKCKETCEAMAAAFSELKLVRGHYWCWSWGVRTHWWLVDPQGGIVDPTKMQFPSKGLGDYEPWEEGEKEPTGMCPNCGRYVYDGGTVCSEKCHKEFVAHCMRGL